MSGQETKALIAGRNPPPILTLPQRMNSLANSVMEVEGKPAYPMDLMPTSEDRDAINSKIDAIQSELAPAHSDAVLKVVATLLMSSPSQAVSGDVAKGKLAIYVEALGGLPIWAISGAAGKWLRGEVNADVRFSPSPGELRRLAEAETLPHRALIVRLQRVLTARPIGRRPDPDERQRTARKFGDLLKSMTEEKRT